MPVVRAYIALGSNVGDRLGQMQTALDRLTTGGAVCVREVSPVYENRAVGMGEAADPFLNAIAEVDTSLAPLDLLDRCLEVEALLGRVRCGGWAPRTIDLDLIAYGDETIEHPRLCLPHPRIAERDFVVHPLSAIAPDLRIRGQGVADLAADLSMDALRRYEGALRIS
jgi:2-amino-4-hydroxy-6-hydroxymethyldihydropteridine diphosphokinase